LKKKKRDTPLERGGEGLCMINGNFELKKFPFGKYKSGGDEKRRDKLSTRGTSFHPWQKDIEFQNMRGE